MNTDTKSSIKYEQTEPDNTFKKKITHQNEVRFIPGMQEWVEIHKSDNMKHHIDKKKKKNHINTSIVSKKHWKVYSIYSC